MYPLGSPFILQEMCRGCPDRLPYRGIKLILGSLSTVVAPTPALVPGLQAIAARDTTAVVPHQILVPAPSLEIMSATGTVADDQSHHHLSMDEVDTVRPAMSGRSLSVDR